MSCYQHFCRVMSVIQKTGCFIWENTISVKVRDNLLCVTNHYIKVTGNLVLSVVSRMKLLWQINFVLIIRLK